MSTSIEQLYRAGQSVWYDNLSRELLLDGSLSSLIRRGEITGVTTNPSILNRAFGAGGVYRPAIESLSRQGLAAEEAYRRLVIDDVRLAADLLHGIYEQSRGADGYVSVEVSPHLADDAPATVAEALDLVRAIDRPNILIKVPATAAGFAAITELTAAGINVNVTLLFALSAYEQAVTAYMEGLEQRVKGEQPLAGVFSVASWFVSRWDTSVDKLLGQAAAETGHEQLAELSGRTALTLAKAAYLHYRDTLAGQRWGELQGQGANPQRLLFASTGTKNPDYSDVYYVENLVGQGTITTLPPATLDAVRDHGVIRSLELAEPAVETDLQARLNSRGIDLDSLADGLLSDGLAAFVAAYDDLLKSLDEELSAAG